MTLKCKNYFFKGVNRGDKYVRRQKFNKNLTIGRHFYLLTQAGQNESKIAKGLAGELLTTINSQLFCTLIPTRAKLATK